MGLNVFKVESDEELFVAVDAEFDCSEKQFIVNNAST
jgi:hypothetical protein